ncbi:MAG: mraZ [Rickettsiales bacterium]|nr:mraZ [Rickettsiales bacterium]
MGENGINEEKLENMALFLSTYVNKVDKKGRVSVPALFRAALKDQVFEGIVAYGSFVNPCIEACAMGRIERLSESIDMLDPYSDERDAFAMTILGGSIQLPFDGEGRVMLTEKLVESAGITDHAVFVGKGATFEIWQPEAFERYAEKAKDLAKRERGALKLQGLQRPAGKE